MAYKQKFLDSIITDAGRHVLLQAGAGEGVLIYTRAIMSSQSVRHLDADDKPQGLEDEEIRKITKLDDNLKESKLTIAPVDNNVITITGSWDNKQQTDDITFSTIGWFARINENGPEVLLAITPTAKPEVLAAGSPDHRSTEAITCDLDMAISNAAKVEMTVDEAGLVKRGEMQVSLTKIKDELDKEIADHANNLSQQFDNKANKSDVNNALSSKADKTDVNSALSGKADKSNTYSKQEIDSKFANTGGVKSVNGNKPDAGGNVNVNIPHVDLSPYAKTADVNNALNAKADKSNTYTKQDVDNRLNGKANNGDSYLKREADSKFVTQDTFNGRINDHENRLKFLEQNAMLGKHFANENDAKAWSTKGSNYIGIVDN
ncbi:hypothetical protein [Lactobacillus intestinalis]|uniref:hypothetical protein n=1 Tax=Lactobacillus intestinalis TaxID=151781 RepID=UPI0002C9C809|nr:hypothetical protein [Lactobacillus intestinalis]KAI4308833.1 hypothetical protein C821_000501 [Lactobacillus intestinalis]